jgi:dienelactone hydrolase
LDFTREDHTFFSKGTPCAGWLYAPQQVSKPPVVVMAHGLGGVRHARLPAFAERFAQNGMAVFLFDYRYFGDSQGTPRQLIIPFRQLDDWQAAIAFVRTLLQVNSKEMALFGTSFSGGHVMVTASRHPSIKAVVAQLPFVDGQSSMAMVGWKNIMKGVIAGLRDLFHMISFRSPYYIPLVADPDTHAFMNTPDAKSGYLALIGADDPWENKAPARLGLIIGAYRPIKVAHKIQCPVLMILAEKETLISPEMTEKTAQKIPNCTFKRLPCAHFEAYIGKRFEEMVKIETEFLQENLNV